MLDNESIAVCRCMSLVQVFTLKEQMEKERSDFRRHIVETNQMHTKEIRRLLKLVSQLRAAVKAGMSTSHPMHATTAASDGVLLHNG